MAGRGPQPKDPAKRARRNVDPVALRVLPAKYAAQPKLPTLYFPDLETGRKRRFAWPEITRAWWKMWADSPLSSEFTATDWSELMDTALLHARYWMGEIKLAGELRLRVAKFGATPEDRARLRITFAEADSAEKRAPIAAEDSARERRGPLHAV